MILRVWTTTSLDATNDPALCRLLVTDNLRRLPDLQSPQPCSFSSAYDVRNEVASSASLLFESEGDESDFIIHVNDSRGIDYDKVFRHSSACHENPKYVVQLRPRSRDSYQLGTHLVKMHHHISVTDRCKRRRTWSIHKNTQSGLAPAAVQVFRSQGQNWRQM